MSFSGTTITGTALSPAGKFNAQELLTKLRAAASGATTAPTSMLSSPSNKPPVAIRSPTALQPSVAASIVQDTSKTSVPSDEKFEVRAQLEKDIQKLTAEIARLRAENKSLKSDKLDLINQMKDQKEKADSTISQLRAKLAGPKNARPKNLSPSLPPQRRLPVSPASSLSVQMYPDGRSHQQSVSSLFVPQYPSSMRSPTFEVASNSQFAEPTFSNLMRYTSAPDSVHLGEAYWQNLRQASHVPTTTVFETAATGNNNKSSVARNNSPPPAARSNILQSSSDMTLDDLKTSTVNQEADDDDFEGHDHVFHLDLTAPPRF